MNDGEVDRSAFLTSGTAAVLSGRGWPLRPRVGLPGHAPLSALQASAWGPTPPIPERVLQHPLLGEVRRFDGAVAPPGWALCEGQVVPVASDPRLFSVLGNSAGGNRRRGTFALPSSTSPYARFIIAVVGALGYPPASIAAVRRGEYSEPDVSVPGLRVLGRPAATGRARPVVAAYPLNWPGRPPTAALLAEQRRQQQLHTARVINPHFRGSPRAITAGAAGAASTPRAPF